MYQARTAAPLREAELAALTDTDLQQSYRTLLQKESQMSANLEKQIGEQFKILDPARMPENPQARIVAALLDRHGRCDCRRIRRRRAHGVL
jgi:hypothetical protein